MKEKIIKYGTMGSYLLLYVIVAIVSLISSIHFFDLAHAGWMSIVLACSFELGQMACLFGALTRKKKGFDIVWIMFIALTLFQCMANTYAAYIGLGDFSSWSELFGLTELDLIDQKRIIATISGSILPLIALGFIKCLTDFLNGTTVELQDDKEESDDEDDDDDDDEDDDDDAPVQPLKPAEDTIIHSGQLIKDIERDENGNIKKIVVDKKKPTYDNSKIKDAQSKLEEAIDRLEKYEKK